jgi:hypothetical protein
MSDTDEITRETAPADVAAAPRHWPSAWPVKALALAALVAVGTYIGFRFGATKIAARVDDDLPLEVAEGELDFGEVWLTDAFPWKLSVRNTGAAPIKVGKVMASCSCSSIKPESFSVPPGETVDVALTLDLTTRIQQWALMPEREFSTHFAAIQEGNPLRRAVWTLTGRVRSPMAISPPGLDFEESLIQGESFPGRTALVRCHEGFNDVRGHCDPALAVVEVAKREGAPREFDVKVTPRETLSLGDHVFTVYLTAVFPNGRTTPGVPLPVEARVVHDIRVSPSYPHLGAIVVGESVHDTMRLDSRTGKKFTVERVAFGSDDFRVVAREGAPPDSPEFDLTCRASGVGERAGDIDFFIRYQGAESAGSAKLAHHLRYQGISSQKEEGEKR